jgi:GABA(A) receptor-associated protein
MSSKLDYTKKNFTEKEINFIKSEVEILRKKYPSNIPIIVICKDNLKLNKNKYLVNGEITLGQFLFTLRKRLNKTLSESDGLFIFAGNIIPPSSEMLSEIYNKYKDMNTGMLYLTLCKENTFGY